MTSFSSDGPFGVTPAEQLLAFSMSGNKIGTWVYESNTSMLTVDQAFEEIFQVGPSSLKALPDLCKLVQDEESEALSSYLSQILDEELYNNLDMVVHLKASPHLSVHLAAHMLRGEDDRSIELVGSAVQLPYQKCRDALQSIHTRQYAEHLAELQASEERFRSIIASIPAAVGVFLGKDFVIDLPNERFIEVIGRGPHIAGKRLGDLLPELEAQNFISILSNVYQTGEPFQATGAPLDLMKNGQRVRSYFDISFSPLRNAAGDIYGILDISIEVTDSVISRQQVEAAVDLRTRQLKDSMLELERSNASLLQFAHVASHDLQEPLRKIQTFSKMLLGKCEDISGGDGLLKRIDDSAARMSSLITDLLNFSEVTTREQKSESVPLNEVVKDVVADLELRIIESDATIELDKMPTIAGDRSQIAQLFSNLIGNAIKFRNLDTKPHIHVSCKTITRHDLPRKVVPVKFSDSYFQIAVADNGIGFEPRYLDRIFQVFQRLHSRAEFDGTGVGLAICEKVATNHGGAITASSQLGKGSTFTVFLPA